MGKDELTPRFADLVKQTQGLMAMNPLLAPQMEQFWHAQEGMLDEGEAFSKAWYARRHEAARSALKLVRKFNGTRSNPMATLQDMADWQRHSLERLTEDMQHWMSLCARCAGRFASAESIAAEEALEETAKRTKAATSTGHATPV